jgi:organic hydroperoxide reductase OsmC/OhrA
VTAARTGLNFAHCAGPRDPTACLRVAGRLNGRMSIYTAEIRWNRGEQRFTDNRYRRAHTWHFDGGITVPASSSPSVVPLPMSDAAAIDPEEAFVASLSSCHLLWFLSLAAQRGYTVDAYADNASGVMAKNAAGKLAMTEVTLRPLVTFSGAQRPDRAALDALHHAAHEECFIAASVRSEIRMEPRQA